MKLLKTLLARKGRAQARLTCQGLPTRVMRRSGHVTLNICGLAASGKTIVEMRVNDGPWQRVGRGPPRAPGNSFVGEVKSEALQLGRNLIQIRSKARTGWSHLEPLSFLYDDKPHPMPFTVEWRTAQLDVQDGQWETYDAGDVGRVRTVAGHEGYDRIVLASGTFSGGRRVETDLVVERPVLEGRNQPHGVGVLPLWGGHCDEQEPAVSGAPRRGWCYGLAWFYSQAKSDGGSGIGIELAHKIGNGPTQWCNTYRAWQLETNRKYRVVAEARPTSDAKGAHSGFRQRMKWWLDSDPEPQRWLELAEAKSVLPDLEYAVGLLAHRVRASFGPVVISPLPPADSKS